MRKRRERTPSVKIQICPRCRSRTIQRVGSLEGDMTGAIGFLPPKYYCLDCGWTGRLIIKELIDVHNNENMKQQ
jgi:hypothetical protein